MSANAGMFEPLTDGEGSAAAKADMDSGPPPIVPVPAEAPQPNWPSLRPKEATTDAPPETWTYHTGNGGSAFVVARWMWQRRQENRPPRVLGGTNGRSGR